MEVISLKDHTDLDEKWLKKQIIKNPKLLNLGSLEFEDEEKYSSYSGRTDLVMTSTDNKNLYVIEMMVGELDESHIIRTILYWQTERNKISNKKIYPILIAESFNNRFFEVAYFLTNLIPFIFIQVGAFKIGNEGKLDDDIHLYFSHLPNKIKRSTLLVTQERGKKVLSNEEIWYSKLDTEKKKFLSFVGDRIMELNSGFNPIFNKSDLSFEIEDISETFLTVELKKSDLYFIGLQPIKYNSELQNYNFEGNDMTLTGNKFQLRISNSEIEKYRDSILFLIKNSYNEFKRIYLNVDI